MDFSLMFWGHLRQRAAQPQEYRLVLEASKFADENDFAAVWVPERHFHPWGGLFPNPSVVCAAIASITKKVRLRAGSVVIPLHHPVRVAEEWSVVDNLSGGRVEVSVASGWRADDFILRPEAFEDRKEGMFDALETVLKLWRGEKITLKNPNGENVEAEIYPRPIQKTLPVWVTSAGSIRTMTDAGSGGFGLLTHTLGQTFEDIEKKVAQYHAYRKRAGLEGTGKVSVMLHTYVGDDRARIKELVKEPMLEYLGESADLMVPANQRAQWEAMDAALKRESNEVSFDRYFDSTGLFGTPATCKAVVDRLARAGVTDICCLVDFGLPTDTVLAGLRALTELKDACR